MTYTLKLDLIGSSLLFMSMIILIYNSTYPGTSYISLLSIGLLSMGIGGGLLWHTFTLESGFKYKAIYLGVIGGLAIILTNTLIKTIDISYFSTLPPLNIALYMVLIAVAEETVIRGFVMPLLIRRTSSTILGLIGSSMIWSIYHFYVSGQDPFYLLTVFTAGIILGYLDIYVDSLTPGMIAHIMNNLMAIV